uniref:Uncharacterized protein n=1 Tax=Opuntia streptacantha TaxID=393608 RepID=A0A7C8YVU2_OPUST
MNRRADVLHCIINCKTSSDGATRGVDVHKYGFIGVFRFKEKELGNDDMGSIIGDGAIDADDALFEKAREDVVGSLPSGRLLNHHRNQGGSRHYPRYEGLRHRPRPLCWRTQVPSPQHACLWKLVEGERDKGGVGWGFRRRTWQRERDGSKIQLTCGHLIQP